MDEELDYTEGYPEHPVTEKDPEVISWMERAARNQAFRDMMRSLGMPDPDGDLDEVN